MAYTRIVDANDIAPVLRRMDQLVARMDSIFRRVMWESVLDFEREAAERTPVGTGYGPDGHLRSSIYAEVRGQGLSLEGFVGTPALHGLPVETGAKAHWPPPGALADWVRLVLGVTPDEVPSVEFLVRCKIAARGTPGRFMFRDAYRASQERIKARFAAAFHSLSASVDS